MKNGCHPASIGSYPVTGILGHGGMGTVYRVRKPETGQVVALKVLNPIEPLRETLGMAALREIFAAETATMARLHHQNIAEVLDTGQDDQGRPFYVMEYFCANLGMMIGEHYQVDEPCRQVPPDKAVAYGCQILAGLRCMHAAGVIHRDIKPFNMLVSATDLVKICDFGMARRLREKGFTARGMRIGSPYYTAPEQIRNPEEVDGRTDLYATGVLLYRMLTGELPAMKDFMLSRVNPLYDPAWDAFFARALSWHPDQRFQDAAEMAAVLERLDLHRERASKRQRVCGGATQSLRFTPCQVTGDKARETFAVDRLWQPLCPACHHFTDRDADTILDETTNLIWQRCATKQQVDRETAVKMVTGLNASRYAGIATWRLPTVNELLSLVRRPPMDDENSAPFPDNRDWFWSCDRRSPTTSWFVNTCLGYAGWQDNGCHYRVQTVSSAAG